MKTPRWWWETLPRDTDWDGLTEIDHRRETDYVQGIRDETAVICGGAVFDKARDCGLDDDVANKIAVAGLAAVQPPPDPRRDARGRTLYETLNPEAGAWDKHGETFRERYRAAAEAVLDG